MSGASDGERVLPRLTPRRLIRAVVAGHTAGRFDGATVLLVEWRGDARANPGT